MTTATLPKATDRLLTVPDIAGVLGCRLDWLRKQLLRRPAAAALFEKAGTARVLFESRLDELKAALAAE